MGWAHGVTCDLINAARMHASAGLPRAPPDIETVSTLPSDLNVTVACEIGSSGPRHTRASGKTTASAPWTAPSDGLRGTLPRSTDADGESAPAALAAAEPGAAPAASLIMSPRSAPSDGAGPGALKSAPPPACAPHSPEGRSAEATSGLQSPD